MTVLDVIAVARRFLQDSVEPYRWSNTELRKNLQFAIRELNKIRPETRYVNGSLVDTIILPESDSVDISLDDRFEECLAYYVVYLAYLNDNTDTVNAQLAEMYLGKFNTKAQL